MKKFNWNITKQSNGQEFRLKMRHSVRRKPPQPRASSINSAQEI